MSARAFSSSGALFRFKCGRGKNEWVLGWVGAAGVGDAARELRLNASFSLTSAAAAACSASPGLSSSLGGGAGGVELVGRECLVRKRCRAIRSLNGLVIRRGRGPVKSALGCSVVRRSWRQVLSCWLILPAWCSTVPWSTMSNSCSRLCPQFTRSSSVKRCTLMRYSLTRLRRAPWTCTCR